MQGRMTALFEQLENWRTQVLNTFDVISHNTPRIPRSRVDNTAQEAGGGESDSNSDQGVHYRPVEVEKAELLLEYHKARRSLLQPLMTEGRDHFPFDTADYTACADASGQICQLYRRLHRLSPIPFSLRDLHAVFVAGFTLIYCVCTCPAIYSAQRASDVGACSTVLYVITEQWSSAKKYRDAFEVVAEKMLESTRKYQESTTTGSSHYPGIHTSDDRSTEIRRKRGPASNESDRRSNRTNGRRDDIDGALLSDLQPGFMNDPRSQPSSYPTAVLPENPFNGEAHATVFNPGMELDLHLDSDYYDIEGLLSSEGLEWFTGAVL